jgi:hypothetical protein
MALVVCQRTRLTEATICRRTPSEIKNEVISCEQCLDNKVPIGITLAGSDKISPSATTSY